MRRILVGGVAFLTLGASALAADLQIRSPGKAPPPVAFSWTGLYVGVHLGYGLSTKEWYLPNQPNLSPGGLRLGSDTISGIVGGGQLGFNYQVGNTVFGIEAAFSGADVSGETCNFTVGPQNLLCTSRVNWVATLTGRLGVAMDHLLAYFKGGAAWVSDEHRMQFFIGALEPTASKTVLGYTVGVGVEYALTRNWSVSLEYDYIGLGEDRFSFTFPAQTGYADIRQRIHTVRFGGNYRFDWGAPIVASY